MILFYYCYIFFKIWVYSHEQQTLPSEVYWSWVVAPIFQLPLGQNSNVRTVLESAWLQLFKTVLTFKFWPSGSWDIEARTHLNHLQFSHFQVILSHFLSNFQKISIFSILFVKILIICVDNIKESNTRCQMEVLKVQKSDYKCWIWIISSLYSCEK